MNAAIQEYILLDRNSLGGFAGEKNLGCQHLWDFTPGLVSLPNVGHSSVLLESVKLKPGC